MINLYKSCFIFLSLLAFHGGNAQISTLVGGIANVGDNGLAINANVQAFATAVDSFGNLYFVDNDGQSIRKLTISTGIITRVAGNGTQGFSGDNGLAVNAQLNYPTGVIIAANNDLLIADNGNLRIRKVLAATGVITTIAGNGTSGTTGDNGSAVNAQFLSPFSISLDISGNLYVTDITAHKIRKINATTGVITTVVGNGDFGTDGDNGLSINAQLALPWGTAVDVAGNLYIASIGDYRIRKVTASTGIISTIAGSLTDWSFNGDNILAINAKLSPRDITIDDFGNLYIADHGNNRVRKIDNSTGIITTIAGSGSTRGFSGDGGSAATAQTNSPFSVTIDKSSNVYFSDRLNNRVRKVFAGTINTVAGTGIYGFNGDNLPATSCQLLYPNGIAFDQSDNLYLTEGGRVRKVTKSNNQVTTISSSNFLYGVQAFYRESNFYIGGSGRITKIDILTGQQSIIGGADGPSCSFNGDNIPATTALIGSGGMSVDKFGNIYFSDECLNRIRKINAMTNIVTTIAGNGNAASSGDNGPASSAEVRNPSFLTVDALDRLYFVETKTKIRRIDLNSGIITTFASGFTNISNLVIDSDFILYVADGAVIKMVDQTGLTTTVVGTGVYGYNGENIDLLDAQLGYMTGMAIDNSRNLIISERNGRIRKISNLLSIEPTLATAATSISSSGFTANWNSATGATGYQLDISTDNFATFVTGYNSKSITGTSRVVTGLGANTTYQYRVRVVNGISSSISSNVISALTLKQNQTITFTAPVDRTLGDAAFSLSATATSGLAVAFSTTSDKIALSGSQVTLVKAGRATISANQAGSNTFNAATLVERSFCIMPIKPTLVFTNGNTETPTLTSSASVGNQWFLNGNAIAGATNATYNAASAGIYKVQVKVDDCPSEFSSDVSLIVTGDLPNASSSISLYPNPVEDYLQIEGIFDIQVLRLIDMSGKERKISLERNAAGHHANVKDLPSGIYVLRLIGDAGVYQLKFVKK